MKLLAYFFVIEHIFQAAFVKNKNYLNNTQKVLVYCVLQ